MQSAVVELVPHTRQKQSDGNYTQPTETAFDASPFSEIGVKITVSDVSGLGTDPDKVTFYLATAMENREDRFLRVAKLLVLTDADNGNRVQQFTALSGPGSAGNQTGEAYADNPAIGRFIRIEMDDLAAATAGSEVSFDVRAIMRG